MKGPSHYCQGIWIQGRSKDCPEPVHNVKLAKGEELMGADLPKKRPGTVALEDIDK